MSAGSVLVSGATGFIGSAVARRLSERGFTAHCLVRDLGPRSERLRRLRGVELLDIGGGTRPELERALAGVRCDAVLHLAAYGVAPSQRDMEALLDGNAGLTARLITAAAGTGATRFVHAGSCSEYAPAAHGTPIDEQHPLSPPSLYGAAKLSAAIYGRAVADRVGLPFVVTRLFGVYGPGEAPERLVPHLVDHLRRGVVPELTGGEQVRDLSYVDDVADALILAATHPAVEAGTAYNVCSGVPVRIRDVALTVARAMGAAESALGLGRLPYRPDEPMWIVGSPERFRAAVSWSAGTPLEDGIRCML